jgi:hypothetical protein
MLRSGYGKRIPKILVIILFDGKNLKTHESYEVLNKQIIFADVSTQFQSVLLLNCYL